MIQRMMMAAAGAGELDPEDSNNIGKEYEGGYLAGIIDSTQTVGASGEKYALIVSPKASGGNSSLQWKTTDTATSGADSVWDGYTNSYNINNTNHPAAQFCCGLTINGYSDWYLPARDEIELLYRNFKPTTQTNDTSEGENFNSDPQGSDYTLGNPAQTSLTDWQSGGDESFDTDWHWSSDSIFTSGAGSKAFDNGNMTSYRTKNTNDPVRAVRRKLL